MPVDERRYNERIFQSGGLRRFLHNSRFEWFRRVAAERVNGDISMVEVGCFDGRLIQFCPSPPVRYEGFDANWEGGLADAQRLFEDHPSWHFHEAIDATPLRALPSGGFNVGACLETLEHVPPALVSGYLAELARLIDGWLFVTVPNEKGIVFLSKWIAKRALGYKSEKYAPMEIVNASLGRMSRVTRNEHKGFDYAVLISQLQDYFEVERVEAIPLPASPPSFAFTIGIVARSKNAPARSRAG